MGSTSVDSNKPSSVAGISSAPPQWQQNSDDATLVIHTLDLETRPES